MADDNDREGSGFDIFEGLGRKNSEKVPVSTPTPPPPPSASNLATVRASSADHRRALLAIAGVDAPDDPPGRGSLPMLAEPKSEPPAPAEPRRGSGQHRIASDPPHARPKIRQKGAGILDDDDDAIDTAVFDKEKVGQALARGTAPASPDSTQTAGGSDAKIYAAPPAPKPDQASLSDAFGALGEPEAGAAISSAMRVVPPPPPVSQKPGFTTHPIPPPPPPKPGGMAGMQTIPSGSHALPPPPASIPPSPTTSPLLAASMPSMPSMQAMPSTPPMQATPPMPSSPSVPPPRPTPQPQSVYPPQSLPPIARVDATYTFPKKEQSSNAFIIAVLVAIAAVAGAAVFFFMPRPGGLVVNVADMKGAPVPNLTVTVDGAKKCDSAPCIVKDLATGTHSVSVAAAGFDPVAPRAITVESSKNATTDFSLVASKAVAANGTGFKVAGPAGVKLTVDGKDVGVLPLELKDIEPGDHRLHFAGDRYAPLDKTVTVGNNEIVDMGNVPLKVTKGKATIQLGTPGTKVTLVNGTTRKEVPQFPMAIEFDPSEKWTLNGTKDGMDPYSEAISFDDGQAEKTYNIVLLPKGTGSSAANAKGGDTTTSKARSKGDDDDDPPPPPRKKSSSSSTTSSDSSSASGDTALKINSLPASSVFVDGNPVGNTPIPHFTVKPGPHTVMFVNSEQSLKKTISVDVKAGETKPAFAKLREE